MAELAGAISVALEQLTVDDDPGADAAPDLDDDQVVRPWPPIERQLGQRGRVAVVGDHHGHAVAALDERPQRKVGPFEVDRPADGPRAGVDHARGADADAEERGRVIGSQGVDEPEDELDGGLAVESFEGNCMERRMSPRRLTTAPLNCESARSRPINRRPSGATRSRIGDLPPLDRPRPTSSIRPSSMRLPTRSLTDVREAGQPGKVGRDSGLSS